VDFVVETRGLTKHFGTRVAVDNVDLRVPRGSAFGYLGPNGAGKTTLIRMLPGPTAPTAGSVRLRGHPVPAERPAALRRAGAMAEEPPFLDHLTGRENLRVNAGGASRRPGAGSRRRGSGRAWPGGPVSGWRGLPPACASGRGWRACPPTRGC